MSFLELVAPPPGRARIELLALAFGAGLTSVLALILVAGIARDPGRATLLSFIAYAGLALASILATRTLSRRLVTRVEGTLHATKVRLAAKVAAAELEPFEQVGRSLIFDRISQSLAVLSLAGSQLGVSVQALCVASLALGYLAWISGAALSFLLPLLALGAWLFRQRARELLAAIDEHLGIRVRFLERLGDMIAGAKELALSRARAEGVLAEYGRASASQRDAAAAVHRRWDDNTLFSTMALHLVLAAVAFTLPNLYELDSAKLVQLIVALLFAWGSLQTVLVNYVLIIEAERALAEVRALERKLEAATADEDEHEQNEVDPSLASDLNTDPPAGPPPAWAEAAGPIVARGLVYAYPERGGEPGFRLGPIDLRVEPGELLLLVGGNGAGKSTLLNLLTGLYRPTAGTLEFAGLSVTAARVADYREKLSVIRSDVHLFARTYGLLDADPEAVEALLGELEIADKTGFVGGRFTNLRLSTGQRKRLALALALLEDRPIVVLDEWAADQDPEFRRHFYERLLPSLRSRGKTVIAVSHDDRYFHCADRVVVLDYGRIREVTDA
jgi:putative pyoverdin transport system ATP-binding/permease protein